MLGVLLLFAIAILQALCVLCSGTIWRMNLSSHVVANSLPTRALPPSLEDDEMHHSVNAVILPSSVLYSERSGECSM